jgi:glycosyltransferase involved in cell wall biosynthesis
MNFPDLLTGFMETWPAWLAPRPFVEALKRYEISMPARYGVDGVLAISDTLADYFAGRGYPRERILPIYYGYAAEHFPFQPRDASDQPPVVVMHGSLDHHHLGRIAFEAIRHVTRARPGTRFRFVGQRTAALEDFLARARRGIPGVQCEVTGFVPYAEVAGHLADASVGIVPYEESAGTHCAFVAKVVEYVASGLPAVSTPLRSIQRYFQNDPMVTFAGFDGEDFGRKIAERLAVPARTWQLQAARSAARVQAELDWRPLCRRAVDFVEGVYARARG